MARLLVATRSRGKQRELSVLLARLGAELLFPDDVGLAPLPEEDTLECHESFEANARAKARWFAERSGIAALADDSGLEVDALDGAPGVRSRRFAGRDGPDELVAAGNNRLLLERLAGIPPERRTARYQCVLVLSEATGDGWRETLASGQCTGRILDAPRGTAGFGYDPLFRSDELGRTFGEVTAAEKQRVSHRARAAEDLTQRWRPAKL